jgi:hypothetical protein
MKRLTVCLLSCLALAGGWLAHSVWGQAADAKEKTITMPVSQWKEYLSQEITKAIADREKNGRSIGPVSDEQVLKGENWHRARFNQAEWVVYTGPGQAMFHHWVEQKAPPARSGATPPATPPATPAGKGG